MKRTLRLISLMLSIMLLLALTACAGANETWAVEVDGEQLPVGLYLYYQFNAYQSASSLSTDTKTALLKQTIEEQAAPVWIHQKTIENCKRYVAANREFARLELSLAEDEIAYVNSIVDYVMEQYADIYKDNGIGTESIRAAITNDQKALAIFNKYYGEGGLEAVAESALMNYYKENYAAIYMFGSPIIGLDEKTVETAKAAADKAVASLINGKSVAAAAFEMNKEIDPDTKQTLAESDDAFHLVLGKADSMYPQDFRDQVFAAEFNLPAIYNTESYLTVFVRKDVAAEADDFANKKFTILQALKGKEFDERVGELAKVLPVTENEKAVSYYSVNKVKDFK